MIAIAMTFNELCTNTTKFGALSVPAGHVDINWTVDEAAQCLYLTWIEQEGPAVEAPTRRSFGTLLRLWKTRPYFEIGRFTTMPSYDHFLYELKTQLQQAAKRGATRIIVNSAELHRAVGGYPGSGERMHYCRAVMKEEMKPGDSIMDDPNDCHGAGLTIVYLLPRAS